MDSTQKIAIWDPRLSQAKPAYGVVRGAASVSAQSFQALTANASQHVYSAIIPSLNTCVDRTCMWSSSFYISMMATYASAPAGSGSPLLISGRDWALCAFPLHLLASNISIAINDSSVQMNTAQCLKSLLHLADSQKARKFASTPCLNDLYADTRSGAASTSNVYGNISDACDDKIGNGAFAYTWVDPSGNALVGTGSYTSGGITVNYVNGSVVTTSAQAAYPVFLRYDVSEPICCSPFTFGSHAASLETALHGITAIQMTAQMQTPAAARIVRQLSNDVAISNVQYLTVGQSPFANSSLQMSFLTPPATLALPERNIVPYSEFQAYPFSSSSSIAAGAKGTVRSNVVTLSAVPDLLIVRVAPTIAAGDVTTADWCLPVQNVSIQFDNASGLLSSVPPVRLFQASQRNGLSMPYQQWSGLAAGPSGIVQMSGGELVLRFGEDIQCFEGNAPGVAGQYSLSVQCDVMNYSAAAVTPTITLIAVSSGQFVSSRGSSQRSVALLTEADVLGAEEHGVDSSDLSRMVGAGWTDKLAGFVSKAKSAYQAAKPMISQVKNQLANVDHPLASKVVGARSSAGFGAPAGAGKSSGAGRSSGAGGRRLGLEARYV